MKFQVWIGIYLDCVRVFKNTLYHMVLQRSFDLGIRKLVSTL